MFLDVRDTELTTLGCKSLKGLNLFNSVRRRKKRAFKNILAYSMAISKEAIDYQNEEAQFRKALVQSIPGASETLMVWRKEAEERPSKVTEEAWVWQDCGIPDLHPRAASHHDSGKWLIFSPQGDCHDVDWAILRAATKYGLLASGSKTATMQYNPNAPVHSTKVTCVYTTLGGAHAPFGGDPHCEEASRVLAQLRRLGFAGRLNYKTDDATLAGQYANRGHHKICSRVDQGFGTTKWWEKPQTATVVREGLTHLLAVMRAVTSLGQDDGVPSRVLPRSPGQIAKLKEMAGEGECALEKQGGATVRSKRPREVQSSTSSKRTSSPTIVVIDLTDTT